MSNLKILTIHELVFKIERQEYFRFPKLLHGFWDRLDFFSDGCDDIKKTTQNIIRFGENFGDEFYSTQLLKSDFFEGRSNLGIGPHYVEIMQLLNDTNQNILWGISDTNFHGNSSNSRSFNERVVAKKWIDMFCILKMVDGCFWKDLIASGEFISFLNAIKDFVVVVIGMKHLSDLNKFFCFDNFYFLEVQMPLAPKMKEFQKYLEDFHRKIGRPVVYMSQMSIDGVPIICKADLPDAFFFDIGRGLDAFSKDAVERGWEETIPYDLRVIYKNECFRKKIRSKMFL